ncbi:MAG: hypothetical protein JWM82_1311, partial [Myxococcales bacterium]|nr:hypothetical protein [Myxococcales bacterium]
MVEIPASLADRLKSRQVVLVAGLRCSALAGAPTWPELGKRLSEWLEDESTRAPVAERAGDARTLAGAIAHLGARVPREALVEVIRDAYPRITSAPEVVTAALRVPWRGVVTTGFDGLWAAAAEVTSPVTSPELVSHAGRFLLELCGSVAAPESLSIGAADARARLAPTGVAEALRALAKRRSFVLVGFAVGDPDLALVTSALADAAGGGPHFLFVDAAGLDAAVLGDEWGATIVTCPSGSVGLEASLRALATAWEDVAAEARPADDDIAAWLEIWRRDPADEAPRVALARAEAALRSEKRWDDLVELLLGRVEVTEAGPEQVELLREVARLYAERLDAPERAFTALEAAFRRQPTSAAVRAELEGAAGKAGLWGELAADYLEVTEEIAADGAAAHHLALARVYAEELDQLADAVTEYEAALGVDAKDLGAATAIVELLTRQERWSDLAPALTRAAALEPDARRAAELRLQLADLLATRLDDAAGALAIYAGVLEGGEAGAGEALDAMEKVARRAERWPDLARALAEKVKRAADPESAA